MEINPAAQPYPGIPKELFLWGITTNKTISNHMGGFFAAGFTWICSLFTANSVNPPLCGKVKNLSRLKGLRGLKPITEPLYPLTVLLWSISGYATNIS
jgi:hypothetical protein